MAWFRILEFLWNWLDTQSKLRIVAVRRDSQLQEELDFRTSEVLYALAIRQASEVNQFNSESVSWYLPVLPSGSCTSPVSGSSHTFVIEVRGIGEHHWHHGAHNGRARKRVRSPPGAILKKVTIWQVHSTRCVPKRQPKAASSRPSPSSS